MSEYIWPCVGAAVAVPVALIIGAAVTEAVRTVYYRWAYRNVPGPTPALVGGNLREIRKAGSLMLLIEKWHAQYGPIFKIFLMGNMLVITADATLARLAMAKMSNRPTPAQPLFMLAHGKRSKMLTSTLLRTRDHLSRALRTAWQPAFSPASLKAYASPMSACAEELCNALTDSLTDTSTDKAQGEVVDVDDLAKRMALNVVGTCAYGLKFDAFETDTAGATEQTSNSRTLTRACQDIGTNGLITTNTKWAVVYAALPNLSPLVVQLARFFPDAPLNRVNKGIDDLFHYAEVLVKNWRRETAETATPTTTTTAATMSKDAFLARILKAQDQMIKEGQIPASDRLSDLTVAAQAATFIIGGSETSGSTITFCLFLIATQPEVEAQLIKELMAHGLDTPATVEDLSKFVYLDAIISEAMRVYPPGPASVRDLPKGVDSITLGGHKLSAGVSVVVPIWTIHRDPKVWGARATEFVPERWLPKDHPDAVSEPVDMNSYMPFGAGPRMCPGYKFALQEVKLTLIMLYQRFTFELAPGQVPLQVAGGTVIHPKGGLMMRPVPRASPKREDILDRDGHADRIDYLGAANNNTAEDSWKLASG